MHVGRRPGDEPVSSVELHRRGSAAAARRAGAEIGDDAAFDEQGAERTDGWRGQIGGGNNFGARERSWAIDREREHAIEVQRPEMSGMACRDVDVVTLRRVANFSRHASLKNGCEVSAFSHPEHNSKVV